MFFLASLLNTALCLKVRLRLWVVILEGEMVFYLIFQFVDILKEFRLVTI